MRRLVNYFLRGLVFVAPIAVTIFVCWKLFTTIDGWLGLSIPGAGFVATLVLITVTGFLASNFLTRSAAGVLDGVMKRVPLVRLLYGSTRDFMNAFVGEQRRFDKPVLVAHAPDATTRSLGFVTQESLDAFGLAGHVAVYLPLSYSFTGVLLVVPVAQLTPLAADSAEVMAFIVSGGVTTPPRRRRDNTRLT